MIQGKKKNNEHTFILFSYSSIKLELSTIQKMLKFQFFFRIGRLFF